MLLMGNQLFLWPFSSSQTVCLPEGKALETSRNQLEMVMIP